MAGTLSGMLTALVRSAKRTREEVDAMSDGREEREEQKRRLEQQKKEDREDWLEPGSPDEWEPERVDS